MYRFVPFSPHVPAKYRHSLRGLDDDRRALQTPRSFRKVRVSKDFLVGDFPRQNGLGCKRSNAIRRLRGVVIGVLCAIASIDLMPIRPISLMVQIPPSRFFGPLAQKIERVNGGTGEQVKRPLYHPRHRSQGLPAVSCSPDPLLKFVPASRLIRQAQFQPHHNHCKSIDLRNNNRLGGPV